MTGTRANVELLEKNKPRQERAKRTYEAILVAAAELLVEVGVERISTNLIAERAGITVPALYRYFPNKYAVLNALGTVLMDKHNAVYTQWLESHLVSGDPMELLNNIYALLRSTYDVTKEQTAGLEIVQSLRAVAPLREVRLVSHRIVAQQFSELLAEQLQRPVDDTIKATARLTMETGYAILEMTLEDETLAVDPMLKEGSRMIQAYWMKLLQDENLAEKDA